MTTERRKVYPMTIMSRAEKLIASALQVAGGHQFISLSLDEARDISFTLESQNCLLYDLAACGVVSDNARQDYVEIQVPRVVWNELQQKAGHHDD